MRPLGRTQLLKELQKKVDVKAILNTKHISKKKMNYCDNLFQIECNKRVISYYHPRNGLYATSIQPFWEPEDVMFNWRRDDLVKTSFNNIVSEFSTDYGSPNCGKDGNLWVFNDENLVLHLSQKIIGDRECYTDQITDDDINNGADKMFLFSPDDPEVNKLIFKLTTSIDNKGIDLNGIDWTTSPIIEVIVNEYTINVYQTIDGEEEKIGWDRYRNDTTEQYGANPTNEMFEILNIMKKLYPYHK